jgi:hypothetical protein
MDFDPHSSILKLVKTTQRITPSLKLKCEATLMKRFGVVSMVVLFCLVGPVALAYAQQDQQEEKQTKHEEQAKPEKQKNGQQQQDQNRAQQERAQQQDQNRLQQERAQQQN